MFHQNTFTGPNRVARNRRRPKRWATDISPRKILRVAIVLTMSFLCWMGIGCFAVEMVQLAAR
jgi:hypothetical protein